MATIESHKSTRSQNFPLEHLAATRDEVVLLSHLLQAAWEVERDSPARRAITAHQNLVRAAMVMLIVLVSIVLGLLVPYLSHALGM